MRRNTDALGFIPKPAIAARWVTEDRYVIQRDRHGKAIGYLIHGRVHVDGTLHIHQACIELDRRNRGFGHQAVATLVARARAHHATRILLRCASDLQAVHFWIACGFLPVEISPGGRRRRRTIVHYELLLEEHSGATPPDIGFGRHPAGPNPIGLAPAT